MHRLTITIIAAATAVTLAACGSGSAATETPTAASGGGASADDAVTVVAKEFAFEPGDLELPADTPVEVVLENTGVVEHDITVDELDLVIHAVAGSTTRRPVELPAGSYTFYCSIPGHRASGMEGTLTVAG